MGKGDVNIEVPLSQFRMETHVPKVVIRRVGIDHKTLAYWRQKDPEFDLRCHEAQADFVSNVESLACGVSTSKEALNLLSRHPLTKDQWAPKEEKNVIKIEFAYNRHQANVIEGEFQEVPQIEAPKGSD